MADILLFHHAQGLTPGVHAFADDLRAAGHTVHVPDFYDGRTFATVDEGVDHARSLGFGAVVDRAVATADDLPEDLVYAGFSLGVMAAQRLAQTRPGARGAVLIDAAAPAEEFGTWPDGLRAQIHGMDADPWFGEEDRAAAAGLAERDGVELFLYPGDAHLFADSSLPSYDEEAAGLLKERVLAFLADL
jgi:dienelactone hydrolase